MSMAHCADPYCLEISLNLLSGDIGHLGGIERKLRVIKWTLILPIQTPLSHLEGLFEAVYSAFEGVYFALTKSAH